MNNLMPIIYTAEGCQPCIAVKRWMDCNNVPYETRGPEDAVAAGYRSVPVVEYRGHVIHGFNTSQLREVFPE